MNKKALCLALILTIIPFTSFAEEEEKSNDIIYYDYSYPLDINEADDSILTNSSYKFYDDKDIDDQIDVSDYDKADVFVNGKSVKSNDQANEQIKEGKNSIDILNTNDKVDVKIKSGKEEAGFKNETNKLDENTTDFMETLLEEEVKENFSGGQITVIKNNEQIYNHNFGYVNNFNKDGSPIDVKDRVKVDENTLFDLASNTKMYATNYSLQKLVYDGKINLDDKVSKYFPSFKDEENDQIKGKSEMRIRDILEHHAGFPPDPQYHNDTYDKDDKIPNGKNDLFSQNRDKTLQMILKTPLAYEPGSKSVYSDVDYMLLGLIVEKVTGQRLDQYFNNEFAKPLNLKHTSFNPLKNGFDKNQIAATELNGNTRDGAVDFKNIRRYTIQGEVHDEKAFYAMEGVSGHAGLFANSKDLAKLANLMLNGGRYKDLVFWDQKTQDEFTKPSEVDPSYALGWREMADGRYAWAFSNLASSDAIGHTGWTGTLTVIDPREKMAIVLLTNKKNSPILDNKKDPNKFYSDNSLMAGYGAITTLIYKSLQENSNELIKAMAKELETSKKQMLDQRDDFYNEANVNDLKAISNTRKIIEDKYKQKELARKNDEKPTFDNKTDEGEKAEVLKDRKISKSNSNNPKTGVMGLTSVALILISSTSLYNKSKEKRW